MPRGQFSVAVLSILVLSLAAPCFAATVEEALKYQPVQGDVEFDTPSGEDLKGCSIKAGKVGGFPSWVVRDSTGHLLRTFVDTNRDNQVDMWCYFQNGVEVYRDVDSNFNGKADQYRWLHTAGTRWGIDGDENGSIDGWKSISAEEVTAEVVKALAARDSGRFARLLLTSDEAQGLGLGTEMAKDLSARLAAAPGKFARVARSWAGRPQNTKWLHFGARQPGVLPAEKGKSAKDLVVYENVVALLEVDDKPAQLWIGSLVQVGATWRLIDAPRVLAENDTALVDDGGFFFRSEAPQQVQSAVAQNVGMDENIQHLLEKLETLDQSLAQTESASEQAKLNGQRADLLERLAKDSANAHDRGQWLRQLADTISAAVQSGHYPGGVARLKMLNERQAKRPNNEMLAAYVKFRYLTAEYGLSLQGENLDIAKLQEQWYANLKQYVKEYPRSPDTGEALLQLAISEEFAGEEQKAQDWYRQIVDNFSNTSAAKKASGAMKRLNSVGKPISLSGSTVKGGRLDLRQYRGKVVLIHYWATWCEPCVANLDRIKQIYAQLGRSGFTPIGVNLDVDKNDLTAFLSRNRLPWPQLHEPGGLDGRLANELGILTLPTMLLLDKDGRVVNRNLPISELETEVKKYLQSNRVER